MKRTVVSLLLSLLFSVTIFAQTGFESHTFTDNGEG